MQEEIIIAGFGGQGVLSMGQILCYSGVMENKEVSKKMEEGAKNFFKSGASDQIARELLSIVLSHEKLE